MRFFQGVIIRLTTLIIAVVAAPTLTVTLVLDAILTFPDTWDTIKRNWQLMKVFYGILWRFWNVK